MRSVRALAVVATVVPALALATVLAVRVSSQSPVEVTPVPGEIAARWGLLFECEQPFYSLGDTLHARFVLANGSAQDAAAWTLAGGGNGCQYALEILDAAGQTVWQAGSVQLGQYEAPACTFGSRGVVLPARSQERTRVAVPLVHQNAGGIGLQGLPLPRGVYQLALEVRRFGPEHPPASFDEGLTYSARVPFRIE